jgi:hypothetical protein
MYLYEFMITTFEEGEKKIRVRARHTYTIHAHTYIGKGICKPNPLQCRSFFTPSQETAVPWPGPRVGRTGPPGPCMPPCKPVMHDIGQEPRRRGEIVDALNPRTRVSISLQEVRPHAGGFLDRAAHVKESGAVAIPL